MKKLLLSLAALFSCTAVSFGSLADPTQLPRATKATLLNAYQGSFKIEYDDNVSNTSYAQGRVAYNPVNDSVFIDSHVYQLAIAEFKIPDNLSQSSDKDALPNAENIQPFFKVLDNTATGNSQNLNRLGGMSMINGELFVQAYETYDAGGNVSHTTAVVRDPQRLADSDIDGLFAMEGTARVVNYLSPVPTEWQSLLQAPWVAGNGYGMSIVSRLSAGPSLYTFNPADFIGRNSGVISTNKFMDYPVQNALSTALWQDPTHYGDWDVYNATGLNDMWTDGSQAWFGFIIPGTRTFAVLGGSSMHESGGGYKITNNAGYICGGACSRDPRDQHSYYWLFDLNDILNAATSYSPLPYEYGIFDDTFVDYSDEGAVGYPTGGSFDAQTGTLVINLKAGTSFHESGHPIISVYKFGEIEVSSPPLPPGNLIIQAN